MAQEKAQQVAEYWNRTATSFDAIYSGEKNQLARGLDRWLRRDMYQRFAWVMRRAGDIRGANACDMGCGSGRFVTALAKQGACVTGLDVAPEMLRLARDLVQREGVAQNCRFVLSDVMNWQTNEEFELVIAVGLFDYIADPLPHLQAIHRLTNGRFLSTWPRAGTWRMAIRKLRLKMAGCPVYFWGRPQIEKYLEQAGFRPECWEVYGQLYCVQAKSA